MTTTPQRRLLAVHAHPDDETIGTGVTMARYAAEGAGVTLVTCTRGEEGEIVVPELAHLGVGAEDRLGEHRVGELAAAMDVLGVGDHRFLGGAGRWRDSGMMGTASNDRPDCFWRADLTEAAADLVAIIREVRPQVVLTYDPNGGYGHPDHIQAHRVATYGVDLAAVAAFRPDLGPAWDVAKLYWTALPRAWVERGMAAMVAAGSKLFGVDSVDDLPMLTPDEYVTARVDGRTYEATKRAALARHVSQVAPDGMFFQIAEAGGEEALGWEFFTLARGRAGTTTTTADGVETDLFDGVA